VEDHVFNPFAISIFVLDGFHPRKKENDHPFPRKWLCSRVALKMVFVVPINSLSQGQMCCPIIASEMVLLP
jgi:hypothetical protein